MIGPLRPRTHVLRVLVATLLLLSLAVLLLVRFVGDGAAGHGALRRANHGASEAARASPVPPAMPSDLAAMPAPPAPVAAASIEGRVLTEAGEPVSGAWVCLLPMGEWHAQDRVAHVQCADDGSFALAGLCAGRWLPHVIADGRAALAHEALVLDDAQHLRDVCFLVASAEVRSGRLAWEDGSTPQDFSLDDPAERTALHCDLHFYGSLAGEHADVEPRGHHAWPAPPGGPASLATVIGTSADAELREGQTAVLDFVVPRVATVRGIALDHDQPVAGAVVQHRRVRWTLCAFGADLPGRPEGATVTTGVDGRFELPLPYAGDVVLWAVAPDGGRSAETRVALSSGSRFEVELEFPLGR